MTPATSVPVGFSPFRSSFLGYEFSSKAKAGPVDVVVLSHHHWRSYFSAYLSWPSSSVITLSPHQMVSSSKAICLSFQGKAYPVQLLPLNWMKNHLLIP